MTNEQKFRLWLTTINGIVTVVRTLIVWGSSAIIVFFAFRSLVAMAGTDTSANIVIEVIARLGLDRWAAYFLAFLGMLFGLRQNQLRQKAIERLNEYPAELEKRIDPSRSSSRLTTRGKTRPEDR